MYFCVFGMLFFVLAQLLLIDSGNLLLLL